MSESTPDFMKLSEALSQIDELPWKGELYLEGQYPWTPNSNCIVLVVADEDYGPNLETDFSKQHGLTYGLPVGDAWQIVDHARQQMPNVQIDQLVDSFNWYYRYDGFLSLTKDTD